MKRHPYFLVAGLLLLFVFETAGASDRYDGITDTPAILAALDQSGITAIDDAAMADIRGQAQYVMVKVLGINTFDFSSTSKVTFTWNPLGFVYGNWGGLGYTANGDPVDLMDSYFMLHDVETLTDSQLLAALADLPRSSDSVWGLIYKPASYDVVPGTTGPDDAHFGYKICVSRISLLSSGGRFILGWRAMPLTEYARREAMIGMGIVVGLQ